MIPTFLCRKPKRTLPWILGLCLALAIIRLVTFPANVEQGESKLQSLTLESLNGIYQNDTALASYIRETLLRPPSRSPYNLTWPDKDELEHFGQSSVLAKLFQGLAGGFFLECWAGDGETESTSLFLERQFAWSGLLVEPDVNKYNLIHKKGRKAYSINADLATSQSVTVTNTDEGSMGNEGLKLPLYSLMAAFDKTQIDLLILHTNGTEFEILQTVPWDVVTILAVYVRYSSASDNMTPMIKYLAKQKQKLLNTINNDMIFGRVGLISKQEMKLLENLFASRKKYLEVQELGPEAVKIPGLDKR